MNVEHAWDSEQHQIVFVVRNTPGTIPSVDTSFVIHMPERVANFDAIHPDRWGLVVVMALLSLTPTPTRTPTPVSYTHLTLPTICSV